MRLALIFDRANEATIGVYYLKSFQRLGVDVKHFWLKDASRIDAGFDAYLRIDDGDYKYDIPHERLKPSFFYASDVHLKKPFEAIKSASRFYDHIFCAQYDGCMKLQKAYGDKVSWLPHAFEPDISRDLGIARKLDVAFIGNDGGIPRKFLLQEIRERFRNVYIGRAEHTALAGMYSSAKIGFNYSIGLDINMRTFEVMSAGAMLLTNYLPRNGFEKLFTDRKDVVVYKEPREIFSLIEFYLKNDSERERIAESGKRLVMAQHTYDKRAGTIIQVISGHIKKGQ